MKSQIEENKRHRVIGIRHTLKNFKDSGLIEDGKNYPNIAVLDIKEKLSKKSTKWYQIGCERGAKEILENILSKKILVKYDKRGNLYLETKLKNITWKKKLKIKIGNEIKLLPTKIFKIKIEDIGFK